MVSMVSNTEDELPSEASLSSYDGYLPPPEEVGPLSGASASCLESDAQPTPSDKRPQYVQEDIQNVAHSATSSPDLVCYIACKKQSIYPGAYLLYLAPFIPPRNVY